MWKQTTGITDAVNQSWEHLGSSRAQLVAVGRLELSKDIFDEFKPAILKQDTERGGKYWETASMGCTQKPQRGYVRRLRYEAPVNQHCCPPGPTPTPLYSTQANHPSAFLSFDLFTAEPAFQCSFNPSGVVSLYTRLFLPKTSQLLCRPQIRLYLASQQQKGSLWFSLK